MQGMAERWILGQLLYKQIIFYLYASVAMEMWSKVLSLSLTAWCRHTAGRHNGQVSLFLWLIGVFICVSYMWSNLILCVIQQVLGLRQLRSGLDEKGESHNSLFTLSVQSWSKTCSLMGHNDIYIHHLYLNIKLWINLFVDKCWGQCSCWFRSTNYWPAIFQQPFKSKQSYYFKVVNMDQLVFGN